ncbi:MAG: DUF1080 domain-containing protein [Reichenbachiella sp.]|uniref:3-keto-disaccharide hydrolase n=1 Tax=Reichenbachiella sp. TaxID=2184521 RepID=UPI003262CD76
MSKLLLTLALLAISCTPKEDRWVTLLDQDLSQWDTYLSFKHSEEYNGDHPTDQFGALIEPVGLNPIDQQVFIVENDGQTPVLKVTGEIYGCVVTKKEYANYHLRLKVRWGTGKWIPRENKLKDSGILYHSIGPHGAEHWRSWMLSQEFQIMQGHMGDFWNQANSAIDVRAYIPEYIMNPVADASQPFIPLGEGEKIPGFCLRSNNYEKPEGEWNTLELICYEGKSIHIVNGEIVMILRQSRYVVNGKSIPLTKGKIQLQSEAAEVYFKDIEIQELEIMPERFVKYF